MSNGDFHHELDERRIRCSGERARAYEDCIARGGSEEICRAEAEAEFYTCLGGLIGCGADSEWAYRYCMARGGSETECRAEGRAAFEACMRRAALQRRLHAHVRGETLRKMLADAGATSRLWAKVFAKPETARIFARKLDEAFSEAGIRPEEGEAFGCILTAGRRPTYLSSLLPDAPEGGTRLFQLFQSDIMEPLLKADAADRIPRG